MKNALVVFNLGERSIAPKSRESFRHAADRWAVDYVEITEPVIKGVHHYWQKALGILKMRELGYCRVLQLDADMLIRSNAPPPFNEVPEDHLGVVSARQVARYEWVGARIGAVNKWAERLNMRPCPDARHLNGGFFLYHTKHQFPLFKRWHAAGKKHDWNPGYLPEQASLSVILHNTKTEKVVWLPHTWNTFAAQQKERPEMLRPPMGDYIYHFTGGDKSKRIKGTWWNHPGKQPALSPRGREVLSRCRDGPMVGVEVGVLRGVNAAYMLHQRKNLFMYLVDTWAPCDRDSSYAKSGDGNSSWTTDDWRVIYEECLYKLRPYHGRFAIIQCDSERASRLFDPQSTDFVFLDGDHSYEGVKADIRSWKRTIKQGGLLCGHDYGFNEPDFGVSKAVLEESDGQVETGSDLSWFIRV